MFDITAGMWYNENMKRGEFYGLYNAIHNEYNAMYIKHCYNTEYKTNNNE